MSVGPSAPSPNFNRDHADYITDLRKAAKEVQDVYFMLVSVRKPADLTGIRDAIAADDFAGLNSDVTPDDVKNLNILLDNFEVMLGQNQEQTKSLFRMARYKTS